ncbi:hypothetical protein D9M72_372130 [compost metagenome]
MLNADTYLTSDTTAVPFSLATDNRIQGVHPLRLYYLNHLGIEHQALFMSSDGLHANARAACDAYVRALGGELLDVHAEVCVA